MRRQKLNKFCLVNLRQVLLLFFRNSYNCIAVLAVENLLPDLYCSLTAVITFNRHLPPKYKNNSTGIYIILVYTRHLIALRDINDFLCLFPADDAISFRLLFFVNPYSPHKTAKLLFNLFCAFCPIHAN